ncbi:thioesterase, partial [Streptomyces sp. MBT58]|nr:thioesterase [Streptomyces sp. MBT58]
MGEHTAPLFPQEVIDEYAALGIDLPALFSAGHLGERMGVTIVEAAAD